jgi:hypothetical protein
MQVDHVKPLYRNDDDTILQGWGVERGTDDIDNLLPSCARCNRWKSTFTLESFRKIVKTSLVRLERDTPNYNLARDFGLISENNIDVLFYFEKK